jgi:hypothetical protein
MVFEGHVEKGMVVLNRPLPLPDGTPVFVEPMTTAAGGFWKPCSLDDLAEQQGVSTPRAVEDLLGGWPADERNDDFEEALLSWRDRELEQRP